MNSQTPKRDSSDAHWATFKRELIEPEIRNSVGDIWEQFKVKKVGCEKEKELKNTVQSDYTGCSDMYDDVCKERETRAEEETKR